MAERMSRKKIARAVDRAVVVFRPIYWGAVASYESAPDEEKDESRTWWTKGQLRLLGEYPKDFHWGNLFWGLHDELGLIYLHRGEINNGVFRGRTDLFTFPSSPADRSRFLLYAISHKIGSQKRLVKLLNAARRPGAYQRLDQATYDELNATLEDKNKQTMDEILLELQAVKDGILSREVLELRDGEEE